MLTGIDENRQDLKKNKVKVRYFPGIRADARYGSMKSLLKLPYYIILHIEANMLL